MAGGAKESVDAGSKSCRVYFETPGCCCDLVASWAGPGWCSQLLTFPSSQHRSVLPTGDCTAGGIAPAWRYTILTLHRGYARYRVQHTGFL